MSLLSFPPRTNQQLDSRAGETLPHGALAEGEASCLGRFVRAPPPLAFIRPKLVTPHQVVVQVDQNEAQLLQQLPSAHTHSVRIWRAAARGSNGDLQVWQAPVSPGAIWLLQQAAPSQIAELGSLQSQIRAQSNRQERAQRKENKPLTPVKPLWCALLFELVLSQCTGSLSLPHILAPLLDPAGDCIAFIHIYHWGTQPARLTNRREGSSVFCF